LTKWFFERYSPKEEKRESPLIYWHRRARGAAARLGLARTTLIAKMKKVGISRPVDHTETTHLSENVEGAEVTTGA